jgi:hypothetical protein
LILRAIVAAALELSHHPAQEHVDVIEREARRHRVPVSLALAVCGLESGVNTRGGILCGCHVRGPDGRIDRSPAAQARCAASTLARGIRRCGVAGALRRYRYGGDCPLADPRDYARRVGALQRRVARRVGERPLAGL